ncbi:hypothetical protein CFB50_23595 [Burkholderia sp. AU33423]|nr:hypothetical protein CFB50_23595 [Burkholderia sp. AU33423]
MEDGKGGREECLDRFRLVVEGYDERYQWLSGVPGHMSPREIRSAPHCLVRLSPTCGKRVRIGAILVCLVFVMFSSACREPRRQAVRSLYARMTWR